MLLACYSVVFGGGMVVAIGRGRARPSLVNKLLLIFLLCGVIPRLVRGSGLIYFFVIDFNYKVTPTVVILRNPNKI